MTVVVILVILAILMMFEPISNKVGGAVGILPEKLRYWSGVVAAGGIGVLLIMSGVAALSIPIVGTAMIIIGLALLAYTLWPLMKPKSSTAKM